MANTLVLKRSSVASKIPLTTDLALGELALNTNDGKLYFKRNNGVFDSIVEVYGSASVVKVGAGGTGVTTLTGLVKGNGASAFTAAVAGTDYVAPSALSSYLPLAGGTMTGGITNTTSNTIAVGTIGGVTRGYLYQSTDGFGLLTSAGGWAVRVNYGTNVVYMPGDACVGTTNADPASTNTAGMYLSSTGYISANRSAGVSARYGRTNAGTVIGFHNGGTQVGRIDVAAASTTYVTSSDRRLKTNVEPLTGAVSEIMQLKPYTFEFTTDPGVRVKGFFADEVQEIVPQAVVGEKNGTRVITEEEAYGDLKAGDVVPDYQGIDHSMLVPLLTAALQEAIKRIEVLEAKLEGMT